MEKHSIFARNRPYCTHGQETLHAVDIVFPAWRSSLGVVTIMPPWLAIWFTRLALGERLRKATSADYRVAFGHFFFLPVLLILVSTVGHGFLDRAGAVAIWALATMIGVIYLFGLILLWAKFVPAPVSAILGIIAWVAFALFSWHHM